MASRERKVGVWSVPLRAAMAIRLPSLVKLRRVLRLWRLFRA